LLGLRASGALVQLLQPFDGGGVAFFGGHQQQDACLLAILRNAVSLEVEFRKLDRCFAVSGLYG